MFGSLRENDIPCQAKSDGISFCTTEKSFKAVTFACSSTFGFFDAESLQHPVPLSSRSFAGFQDKNRIPHCRFEIAGEPFVDEIFLLRKRRRTRLAQIREEPHRRNIIPPHTEQPEKAASDRGSIRGLRDRCHPRQCGRSDMLPEYPYPH